MRKNCSPWAGLIGAAIMAIMLHVALSGDVAGRTIHKGINNKVVAMQMVTEQAAVNSAVEVK